MSLQFVFGFDSEHCIEANEDFSGCGNEGALSYLCVLGDPIGEGFEVRTGSCGDERRHVESPPHSGSATGYAALAFELS